MSDSKYCSARSRHRQSVSEPGDHSAAWIEVVDRQLDFLAVAAKSSREELKETGETQKWKLKFGGRETHPGRPFALFLTVGYAQTDLGIANGCISGSSGN